MTRGVPVWRWGDSVDPVWSLLSRGGVLAIPTESSYGLAADPRSAAGVGEIFRIKGRPTGKPLPVVVADLAQIRDLGGDPGPEIASGLTALWPGPLTLLLELRQSLAAAGGEPRCAFRVPAHDRLRELLHRLGHGLTASSANRSGEPPIVDPAALPPLLIRSDAMIVDDGMTPGGPPSTICLWREGRLRIVRVGALSRTEIEAARDRAMG